MTTEFSSFSINNLSEISLIGGTYKELHFDVYSESGSPVDITGYTYKWLAYPYGQPDAIAISKTGVSRASDGFINRFTVYLSSLDTVSLSGKYVQQPVVVVADGIEFRVGQGNIIIIPGAGYMTVTESVTLSSQVSELITNVSGSITSITGSIVEITGSIVNLPEWTFLTTPLTSTDWDGDAHSTEVVTEIDLSTKFGVPDNIKAVLLRLTARDSAAVGTATNIYLSVGPSNTYYYAASVYPHGGDLFSSVSAVVPCSATGNIYYKIIASAALTLDAYIEIYGYYI